ncbi:MAG: hypothetical protein FWF44_05070, partial [Defluviitaleaceae bacterium]|nr:hypothetical protein [Defluviitaleaceae bacterium]
MVILRRAFNCVVLLVFVNILFLSARFRFPPALSVFLSLALLVLYIIYSVRPIIGKNNFAHKRLRALLSGRECVLTAAICFLAEAALYLALIIPAVRHAFIGGVPVTLISASSFHDVLTGGVSAWILVLNAVLCVLILFILSLN